MESAFWTILGTSIGIIGTLVSQYFNMKYDMDKTKHEESLKIIQNKYNSFKQSYKIYENAYANILLNNYSKLLHKEANLEEKKRQIKENLEIINNTYMDSLKNIIEILNEDYYLIENIIEFSEMKQLYIKIIGVRGNIFSEVFLWSCLDENNKEKIINLDKEYIGLCKELDEKLKELDSNFQILLYKDVIKNC